MIRPSVAKRIMEIAKAEEKDIEVSRGSKGEIVSYEMAAEESPAAEGVELVGMRLRAAPPKKSRAVVTHSDEMRERIRTRIDGLEKGVNQLALMGRTQWAISVASAVLTAAMSGGAYLSSNGIGLATTIVAGGSGTVGIVKMSMDSLSSYATLKNMCRMRIVNLKNKLSSTEDDKLPGLRDEVEVVWTWMEKRAKES